MIEVVPEYYGHSQEALEELFSDTRSQQLIQKHTVLHDDSLINLPETAAAFGAKLLTKSAGGNFGRLRVSHREYEIHLEPDIDGAGRQFVFAHEIGHIVLFDTFAEFGNEAIRDFYARTREDFEYYKYIEAFCDYFAGHMIGECYPKALSAPGTPSSVKLSMGSTLF